jgi:O-antigen ligase
MYENHNDYSFIIVQALPFFYLYWRNETGWLRRTFLLAATLASIVGVFLSLSRGGMLALVLEVLLIVIYTMSKRARVVLLPIVLAMGAAAISYQYMARAANQGNDYTAEDAESSRYELWEAGEAMLKAHPFLGVGSGSFGEYAKEYAEISHDNLGKNAHNTFVEVAATSGLLGFSCFVLMLRAAIRELRRPRPGAEFRWEEITRQAALISLWTMCLRAMFDAKPWDWSFYFLAIVAAAGGAMLKSRTPPAAHDPVPAGEAAYEAPPTNRIPA